MPRKYNSKGREGQARGPYEKSEGKCEKAITIRLTLDEKARLEACAESRGVSVSAILRELILSLEK